jgi:chemotaxis protein histidine kinase CheA
MDCVLHTLSNLGGDVKIKSEEGRGTIVTLIIPIPKN